MADYYNSQFSGKEVDDAIEKIRSIIANPSEIATLDLDKITINRVTYNVSSICEKIKNKTNTISAESTNEQYPSAKAVYDFVASKVDAINTELAELDTGAGV